MEYSNEAVALVEGVLGDTLKTYKNRAVFNSNSFKSNNLKNKNYAQYGDPDINDPKQKKNILKIIKADDKKSKAEDELIKLGDNKWLDNAINFHMTDKATAYDKKYNNGKAGKERIIGGTIRREAAMILIEALNTLLNDNKKKKIKNNTKLDDKTVTELFNNNFKNLVKETNKYIDKQYDLMFDKNNKPYKPLNEAKKLIPERIYEVIVDEIDTPKYGKLICFEVSIDTLDIFNGHIIIGDYYISTKDYKYIFSEFLMHG